MNLLKKSIGLLLLLLVVNHATQAQVTKDPQYARLVEYFTYYTNPTYSNTAPVKIESIEINDDTRRVHIYVNESFQMQPFTPSLVKQIYNDTKDLLPAPYNTYMHTIYAKGTPIEFLIPADLLGRTDSTRTYQGHDYRGNAWVTPMSLPYTVKNGLQGRHLCIWQSHGRYYNDSKRLWEWQRPNLFCTTEDMLTQTFVVPYLMPMLERAGAIVYTPRERDWQKEEIIVDNDVQNDRGQYTETNGRYEWQNGGDGFAPIRDAYIEDANPFTDGTVRRIEAMSGKRQNSSIRWTPNIRVEGDYAVYVSYKTLLNSVSDATYTVRHEGISTEFRVNQRMGGGTWVYLGTFHFKPGCSYDNCVMLTNQSNNRGVITADAVRFGGGMGSVARRTTEAEYYSTSSMPRALEAARYHAQYSGFGRDIYGPRDNDYNDDIIVRPNVENYLSRGSYYNPGDSGLCVPIELSMGVHSDAGIRPDNTLIGTLGIYTADYNFGKTAAGLSRLTSRDLIDAVMTQISSDLTKTFGGWNRRAIYDRNYGETREPQVPAVILEMFSHQNWADMRLAHDPFFKFMFARAVYKGILRFSSHVHGQETAIVQPMPVTNVTAELQKNSDKVLLTWDESFDPIDASATPTHYIIYRAAGDKGFDNGILVDAGSTKCELEIEPGIFYRFAIAACNAGGASGRSEEVCVYKSPAPGAPNILVMDGFQRVAGPLAFDQETIGGFDMNTDPGVADVRTAGYCGYQINFNKAEYGKNFGLSNSELEGMILAGNTHDYTTRHALDILASGLPVNISSCIGSSLERINLSPYRVIDLAMGAQKNDGYSVRLYKTFTPSMCDVLARYTRGGGRVLLSGAYIGTDMQEVGERRFTREVLKYDFMGSISTDSIGTISGMNTQGQIYSQPSERHYWIRRADVITPAEGAFCAMVYSYGGNHAAVAYPGQDYRTLVYGFPLECITSDEVRRSIFSASIRFLLE